ncbi:MAG: flavin monoamine oxidase family protein [Woeseiaceae bacterium]
MLADFEGYGYDAGFSFQKSRLVIRGRSLDTDDYARTHETFEKGLTAVNDAGRRGFDVAASDSVKDLAWKGLYPVFSHVVGLITSATPEHLSTLDYSRGDDTGEDYPVRNGLGALIRQLGTNLNVHLSTRVNEVDWSRTGIRIATERGTICARSALLTVSTSVLGSGGITFTPHLPTRIASAISNCPLGTCEKVAFLLNSPLGMRRDESYLTVFDPDVPGTVPVSLYVNPFGYPTVIADLAGSCLPDLVAEGEPAMIDAATQAMVNAFGADIRDGILKATATRWTKDADILGAYSYVRPGCASDRFALSEPIGDKLFLAGEAVSIRSYATCHGAYQSGLEAADKALVSIGARGPAGTNNYELPSRH